MNLLEFKHIEYFIETCHHKSFSKAAGSLFISQQALSRCIANLEKDVACTLFKRAVQGIDLTDEGKYLYAQFRPIVKTFHDTAVQTAAHFEKRPVKLPFCCAPGIIRNISADILISFSEQHPDIALEAIELNDMQCEDYIHEDARHFGLMVAPEWKHRQKHDYIMIKTELSYLLVHKDNPLAACSTVSLSVLKNERVLALDKTSYFQEDLNHAVEPYNFSVRPFYESADVTQLCGLVDKGKGVLLSIRQVLFELAYSNIVLIPLEERTFDYSIAFVFQDYDGLDTAAKQFIRFIIENISPGSSGADQQDSAAVKNPQINHRMTKMRHNDQGKA